MAEQTKASEEDTPAIAQGHLIGTQEDDEPISKGKTFLKIAQESGDKEGEMRAYTVLSEAHLCKGEYDDVIFYGEQCFAIAQECNSKISVKACITLGKAYLGKKEYDEAVFYSELCLAIAEHDGSREEEMNAYKILGEAHLNKKEYDDAIFYSEICLAIAEQDGSREKEMNAYKILGEAHLNKKEYDDAIFYSEICLAVAEEHGDVEEVVKALEIMCQAKLYKGECDDAILYAKKCLAMAKEWERKDVEQVAHLLVAQAYLTKGEHDKVISYSEKCLAMAKESGDKEKEMNAFLFIGEAYVNKGEHDKAIAYGHKCLAMAKDLGDKEFEMYTLDELAKAHLSKGEHDDAIVYGEKRLAMAKETGDKESEMGACITMGLAHLRKKENDEVIFYGEKCAAIAQELDNKVYKMTACNLLMIAHQTKVETGKKALPYDKNFHEMPIPMLMELYHDINKEVAAQMDIVLDHLSKEEYDDAILEAKKCIAVVQESGDEMGKMLAIYSLMHAHFNKGEYEDMLFWLKRGFAFIQELDDSMTLLGDQSTGIHGMLLSDLVCGQRKMRSRSMDIYHNNDKVGGFGGCKGSPLRKEDYDDAASLVKQYLKFAQELGNKEAEMNMCCLLGSIHLNNDKSNDAYYYFKAGRKIAETLEHKQMVSMFTIRLCSVYESLGLNEELLIEKAGMAHSIAKDAIVKYQSLDPFLSELHERFCHHRQQHEYEQAICCLEEFISTAREKVSEHVILSAKYSLSEMYVLQGQYDEGMKLYLEVFDVAQKLGNQHLVAQCHFGLGEIYYKQGQIEKAEDSIRKSLECFELLFDHVGENDQFKIAIVEKHIQSYKLLFKVLVDTGKEEEALVLADGYRARALKDILLSKYGVKIEPSQEALQYADIQDLVSSRNYTLLFYSTSFEELCTFLIQEGEQFEFSLQNFKGCDRCLDQLVSGAFADMKVREAVACEDRSLGIMDDFNENKSYKEHESAGQCQSCFSRGTSSKTSDSGTTLSCLEKLHQWIINDVKESIKQDEIVIIPEGPLFQVPFPALRDPDTGRYLSETKRIRLAPSMATLKLLQERPVELHSVKDALVIGAPLVGRVMMHGLEKELDPLEGALEEAADVAIILKVRPLLAAKATKPLVLEKLQQGVSIVHIAAHGSLSRPAIVLAPPPEIKEIKIPEEDDYMLTMADVQQAKVRAQLVVLSCCHSGRGEIKAEGVVGMCRAFLASGARAVIGSLWAIDDEATRKFMKKFYKHLKAGKSASTSLHLTMNDMRRKPQYSEPRYWAPFFLMGDDVTITF